MAGISLVRSAPPSTTPWVTEFPTVQSLVPLFESQNQTPRLIKKVGKREIANAEQLGNMLRGGQSLVRALGSPHQRCMC